MAARKNSLRELFGKSLYRMWCVLSKELYFDKYDRGGAYHWRSYYETKIPFYVNKVQLVKELVPPGSEVLDLGCGDGLIAHVLAEERQCRVTGVDSHPLAIAFAREKNRNQNVFQVKSVYTLRFTSQFDVALAVEIFEHIRKPEVMLQKVKRALKRDGSFIVTTPLSDGGAKALSRHHVKEYSKEEFHAIIEKYFEVIDTEFIDYPERKTNCYIARCLKR